MAAVRWILRHVGYPVVLGGALITSWLLARAGTEPLVNTGGVVLGFALLIGLLERVSPHCDAWRPTGRSALLDITHSLVSALVVVPIVRGGLALLAVAVGAWLSGVVGSALWPQHWPLPAQLALAVVAADFGAYWSHRSMHLWDAGWRAHALHHSPEGLNFLAAGRSHPFNAILVIGAETAMVVALGITMEALALLTVYKGVNGLLQHANIDMRPRVLSHVLATSEVHRWHHTRVVEESNQNFGNTTMIWDRLFGTFFLPSDRRPPLHTGIEGMAIPERYLAHLGLPFMLQRYEIDPDGDPPIKDDG